VGLLLRLLVVVWEQQERLALLQARVSICFRWGCYRSASN
jgi:hypothetical protein